MGREFENFYKGITKAHSSGPFVILCLWAWKPETNTLCWVLRVCVFLRHYFSTATNLHCPRGSCDRYQNWECPGVTNAAGKQKRGKENRDPKRGPGFARLQYKSHLA